MTQTKFYNLDQGAHLSQASTDDMFLTLTDPSVDQTRTSYVVGHGRQDNGDVCDATVVYPTIEDGKEVWNARCPEANSHGSHYRDYACAFGSEEEVRDFAEGTGLYDSNESVMSWVNKCQGRTMERLHSGKSLN